MIPSVWEAPEGDRPAALSVEELLDALRGPSDAGFPSSREHLAGLPPPAPGTGLLHRSVQYLFEERSPSERRVTFESEDSLVFFELSTILLEEDLEHLSDDEANEAHARPPRYECWILLRATCQVSRLEVLSSIHERWNDRVELLAYPRRGPGPLECLALVLPLGEEAEVSSLAHAVLRHVLPGLEGHRWRIDWSDLRPFIEVGGASSVSPHIEALPDNRADFLTEHRYRWSAVKSPDAGDLPEDDIPF